MYSRKYISFTLEKNIIGIWDRNVSNCHMYKSYNFSETFHPGYTVKTQGVMTLLELHKNN